MSDTELQQLQVLCEAMYCGSKEEQNQAHTILLPLVNNAGNVGKLKNILATTDHVHTLIFTTAGLLQLITNEWNKIEQREKDELKEFVISYLYSKGVDLLNSSPNILGNFVRLYVRIVKLSWLESTNYTFITKQVECFLHSVTSHWIIGLHIYSALIEDMHPQCGVNSAKSRRCAISFRDYVLKDIFRVGIETLEEFVKGSIRIELRADENKLLIKVLELIYNTLSFDFMGTMINDESSDENISLMVPQSWEIFHEKNIPKLFFDMYAICMSEDEIRNACGNYCLRSLTLLSTLRKTYFTNEKEKMKYMREFLSGITRVIQEKLGLNDESCFHELCRLIGKIDTSVRIQELSSCDNFHTWCEHIFAFTVNGLKNWKYVSNSMHYLLGIWSHMLNIVPSKIIEEINNRPINKDIIPNIIQDPFMYVKKEVYTNNNSVLNAEDMKYIAMCDYIYIIAILFIDSRLELAKYFCEKGDLCEIENPLYNDVLRAEQLELISNLCKLHYNVIGSKLLALFYEVKRNHESNLISPDVFKEQVAWLVFMIGSMISSNAMSNVKSINRANVKINSEMCFLVFSLMEETNKTTDVFEYLEFAYLNCLEVFKKVYMSGEKHRTFLKEMRAVASQIMSQRNTFENNVGGGNDATACGMGLGNSRNMNETMQLQPTMNLLNSSNAHYMNTARPLSGTGNMNTDEINDPLVDLIIDKILFNLNHRVEHEQIIKKSLELFDNLVSGMNIISLEDKTPRLIVFARLLLKNEKILNLLQNRDCKFMNTPKYYKYRTNYFLILTKLLFMEKKKVLATSFEKYIAPINNLLDCIKEEIARNGKEALLKNNELKWTFIGVLRDLRGICLACNNVETYNIFFDFFISGSPIENNKMNILSSVVDVIWDSHEICVPFLKFMCEFVCNKAQRITFPKSSPNGIYLFKAVSNILIVVSTNLLRKEKFVDLYKEKYKIISLLLNMFNNCLNGDFVNFAIFDIYNDDILTNSLTLALNMCLVIPTNDLLSYIKHLKPYFSFLDLMTKNFFQRILNLEFHLIADIIHNVKEGLCSFDYTVSMTCCSIMDNIVTYIYNNQKSTSEQGQIIRNFLGNQPQALTEVMNLMFHLIVGGEFSSTWSMSQPLLGLILLNTQEFFAIQEQLLAQQSEEKKQKLRHSFCKLMDNIESSLTPSNKDYFTKNLYTFAQEIRNILI